MHMCLKESRNKLTLDYAVLHNDDLMWSLLGVQAVVHCRSGNKPRLTPVCEGDSGNQPGL